MTGLMTDGTDHGLHRGDTFQVGEVRYEYIGDLDGKRVYKAFYEFNPLFLRSEPPSKGRSGAGEG